MSSRMEKYNDESKMPRLSRSEKNEELYKKVNNMEIDKFSLNSNVSVLGDSDKSIDVGVLRKLLDTKYNDEPKRRSIKVTEEENEQEEEYYDEDKDYDLNTILEKAREQKQVNYHEERLKKIRDTQYDILKDLNIGEAKEEPREKTEDKLMTLINTINAKALQKEQADALDLLSDLKGSENTMVIEGINEESDVVSQTPIISLTDISSKKEKESKEIDSVDKSFFTNSLKLKSKDFEDLKASDEEKGIKLPVKILIFILVLLLLAGLTLILDSIFDWGLINYLK